MKTLRPDQRTRPFIGSRTHGRLRHDHALWLPEHVAEAMRASERGKPKNHIPYADRSKFGTATSITEAIERSYEHDAIVAKNGNHVIVFDIGYVVGFDERGKRETTAVTVVTAPDGEVITVHPGTPWAKDSAA